MKIASCFLVSCIAACCLAAATATATAAPSTTAADYTVNGHFTTNTGYKGTYTETHAVTGDVTTNTLVLTSTATSSAASQTSTITTTTTRNTDGSKTVVFSDQGFGASAASTETINFAAPVNDKAVGTGTFTLADGTTGTLKALKFSAGGEHVTSLVLTSAAGAVSEAALVSGEDDRAADELLSVSASNVLTATTIKLSAGNHHR